jgi:hypothetical protein
MKLRRGIPAIYQAGSAEIGGEGDRRIPVTDISRPATRKCLEFASKKQVNFEEDTTSKKLRRGHAMQWRSGEKFNESESVINHPNPSNLPGWFSPDPRWG